MNATTPIFKRWRMEAENFAPKYVYHNLEWWKLTAPGIVDYKRNADGVDEAIQVSPDTYEQVQTDWVSYYADLKRRAKEHKKFCKKEYPNGFPKREK